MRRLVLVRHGEAAGMGRSGDDHSRPLTPRGWQEASVVGRDLAAAGWFPDLVIASDADRTRETWEAMATALGAPVRWERRLYTGGVETVRDCVAAAPEDATTLLLVGHNPVQGEAVGWFAGEEHFFATADAVLLESEAATWKAAAARPGLFRQVGLVRAR